MGGLDRVSFLELDGVCFETFQLVSSLREFSGQLVVILRETAVLLDESVDFELQFLGLAEFDLQERYLIEESSILCLRTKGVLEVKFFFDELSFDAGRGASGILRRGVSVVTHLSVKILWQIQFDFDRNLARQGSKQSKMKMAT